MKPIYRERQLKTLKTGTRPFYREPREAGAGNFFLKWLPEAEHFQRDSEPRAAEKIKKLYKNMKDILYDLQLEM